MSYARFGWDGSDVYVFLSSTGLECCGCILQRSEWVDDPESFFGGYLKALDPIIQTTFDTTAGMVAHLREHTTAGHRVPDDVIPELQRDDAENMRYLATGDFT